MPQCSIQLATPMACNYTVRRMQYDRLSQQQLSFLLSLFLCLGYHTAITALTLDLHIHQSCCIIRSGHYKLRCAVRHVSHTQQSGATSLRNKALTVANLTWHVAQLLTKQNLETDVKLRRAKLLAPARGRYSICLPKRDRRLS